MDLAGELWTDNLYTYLANQTIFFQFENISFTQQNEIASGKRETQIPFWNRPSKSKNTKKNEDRNGSGENKGLRAL